MYMYRYVAVYLCSCTMLRAAASRSVRAVLSVLPQSRLSVALGAQGPAIQHLQSRTLRSHSHTFVRSASAAVQLNGLRAENGRLLRLAGTSSLLSSLFALRRRLLDASLLTCLHAYMPTDYRCISYTLLLPY